MYVYVLRVLCFVSALLSRSLAPCRIVLCHWPSPCSEYFEWDSSWLSDIVLRSSCKDWIEEFICRFDLFELWNNFWLPSLKSFLTLIVLADFSDSCLLSWAVLPLIDMLKIDVFADFFELSVCGLVWWYLIGFFCILLIVLWLMPLPRWYIPEPLPEFSCFLWCRYLGFHEGRRFTWLLQVSIDELFVAVYSKATSFKGFLSVKSFVLFNYDSKLSSFSLCNCFYECQEIHCGPWKWCREWIVFDENLQQLADTDSLIFVISLSYFIESLYSKAFDCCVAFSVTSPGR